VGSHADAAPSRSHLHPTPHGRRTALPGAAARR
jgi:hypothetical protein